MTLWVLQQTLTPQEEANIEQRTALTLPFESLPDLAHISGPAQARSLLKALHPEEPPEGISRRFDTFWNQYTTLQREDIIAVPLKSRDAVAIAEVMERYRYLVGEGGSDVHQVIVTWHKIVPMSKFRKIRSVFERKDPMFEIGDEEARVAIRDHLPHSYNRFVKFKWLMLIMLVMGLVRMMIRLDQ